VPTALQTITFGQAAAVLVPTLTIIGIAWGAIAKVGPILRRMSRTMDDLQGEPARPGVPARPGLMERMEAQEVATEAVSREVAAMRTEQAALSTQVGGLSRQVDAMVQPLAQLQPNHGSSLHDKINEIALETARAARDAATAAPALRP